MIAWILRELEKNPTSVFRKRDLLKISEQQFEELRRLGFLTYVQPGLNSDTYPCSLPCENTCPMDVAKVGGKLFAVCPNDSELDPIPLDSSDVDKYTFCVEKFLERVRTANRLDGTLQRIGQDYLYLGYASYKGRRVGFVFGFTIARQNLLELTGLKRVCADDYYLVVFSPVSMIKDVPYKRQLEREKVIHTCLASSLDFQTCEFSVQSLLSRSWVQEAEEGEHSGKAPLVRASRWEEISIEVIDDTTVKYKAGAESWQRADYSELGFRDERKTLPNKLWPILLSLAAQNRPTVKSLKMTPKDIQRIRKVLRKAFGLQGMPIQRYDKKNKRYPCKFRFVDPREW